LLSRTTPSETDLTSLLNPLPTLPTPWPPSNNPTLSKKELRPPKPRPSLWSKPQLSNHLPSRLPPKTTRIKRVKRPLPSTTIKLRRKSKK
jgi:hypothetical protein